MNRKKIYFLRANNTRYGGAEIYLSRLSRVLKKNNIEHEIVNSLFPHFFPSWLRAMLFNLQVSTLKGNRFYFSLDRVTCPDIYRAGDGVHKTFLSIEKKSKLNPLHLVYLFIEKRCFKKAVKIIAISKMVKNNIISKYNVDPEKICVIYNGIELKKINYEYSLNSLSKEFSIRKGAPIILFVGSGFKRKGVEEFLKIFAELSCKNAIGIIVGKDKNMKYFKTLAINLGIDSRAIFTGPRSDVDNFFNISDIFLFPTHYEPFGNVILEAMNFKNAVFTTNQCGGGELLGKEFIMQNSEDFSVVGKIDALLKDDKSLKRIQEDNRIKSQRYSIDKNLEHTLNVIDEVIN